MGVKYAVPVMIAAFLIMGANSDAATKNKQPKASLVKEADVSRTLSFDEKGKAGASVLLAAKPGEDEIQVTFISKDGSITDVKRGNPEVPRSKESSLAWQPRAVAGSPQFSQIELRVHKARDASPEDVAGTLVINPGNGAKPLTVDLAPGSNPKGEPPTVQPESVTIEVTREWGPFTFGLFNAAEPRNDKASTTLIGTKVTNDDLLTKNVELSSGSNSDQVTVGIEAETDADGYSIVTLKAKEAKVAPGEYSAKIPLVEGKDSPVPVEVKVLVRDSLFWPILVAFVGSGFGWYFMVGRERRRRVRLLRNAVRELSDATTEARSKLPRKPFDRSKFKKALGAVISELGGIESRLTQMLRGLKGRVVSTTQYEKEAGDFDSLDNKKRALVSLANSVNRLSKTAQALEENSLAEHSSLAVADTKELLSSITDVGLNDVEASQALQEEVARQTEIIVVFMRLIDAYTGTQDETPAWLYDRYAVLAYRGEAETRRALLQFNSRIVRREAARPDQGVVLNQQQGDESTSEVARGAASLDPTPDPADIVKSIRRTDLVTGLVIAFIVILAGVLVVDSFTTFGSCRDYLLLFIASATAQGIPTGFKVNWDQLGPGRSLKHSKTETKA